MNRYLFARNGFLLFAGFLWFTSTSPAKDEKEFDVVIYGGTSAAITAAVQVKKMGKTVVIVSPDKHLGGLTSGGLGFTDTGNKAVIGGLSREFYHRIWKHYQTKESWKWQKSSDYGNKGQGTPAIDKDRRTMWIFEPSAAEKVFDQWVAEWGIPVKRESLLDRKSGVTVKSGRIQSLRTLDGTVYKGRMFVDATYEGDLMATAGVTYHVGREAQTIYQEKWNGVQTGVLHHGHWFKKPIDPYVIPGDPTSGLLPRISPHPPGKFGEGDHRVQAYCFRMCLTNHPDNRVPFPKPKGYDAKQYQLLLRVFDSGWRETFNKFDPIPNLKTDTNNHGPFSTDNIGMNYDYPEASYDRRREIIEEHETYQKGLMYFLANDKKVPLDVREKMSKWGLAKDEFQDNGNWPHQIYVREARRMVGKYVMTEHECLGQRNPPDPVGMGSYTMDSHNVQRYVTPKGFVQNEGDIGVKGPPYQISYGSLTPKKDQCRNLLVPVAVSSSHIAFGSIRMEPVFMILGQSAATAASLALDDDVSVQDLDYAKLREQLVKDGQVLQYVGSSRFKGLDPSKLKGIVLDDSKAKETGRWTNSASVSGFVGNGYIHDGDDEKGNKSVLFKATVKTAGLYEVRIAYTANPNRASNVPVAIKTSQQSRTVTLDQRATPPVMGRFKTVAKIKLEVGDKVDVTISNKDTDGHVIVDAVWLYPTE